MSNGIMEKNLPVAESLGSGDKVRIVTSAGNSKQINADEIGKDVFTVNIAEENGTYVADKPWNDAKQAILNGISTFIVLQKTNVPENTLYVIPVICKLNIITGNFLVVTASSEDKLISCRVDWVQNGNIIITDTSYTLTRIS